MDNFEGRIANLEAEVARCARHNRWLQALVVPLCLLAGLPFLLAWNSGSDGDFDRLTARTIIVKSGDKALFTLGSSFNSGGAELKLFGADRKLAARFEADRDSCGVLSLFGPNSNANQAQAQLSATRTGNGRLKMDSSRRQNAVYLSTDGRGRGFLSFDSSMFLGMDSKEDATLRLSDREGKPTVVLDALPRNVVAGTANKRTLPGKDVSSTGGGGRLTLTDPSGAATFRAPASATGN